MSTTIVETAVPNGASPTEATPLLVKTNHIVDEESGRTENTPNQDKDPYWTLTKFRNFRELVRSQHYRKLPSDWWVLVADIQGSTLAIEQGRYRDVNTAGAMCISVVRNALLKQAKEEADVSHEGCPSVNDIFPYVFGGDGASLVVRPHEKVVAVAALLGLKRLIRCNYALYLRVGAVSVGQLEDGGVTVEVARYEVTKGLCIALFRGGGLSMADAIVKGGQEEFDQEDMEEMEEWSDDDDTYFELTEAGSIFTYPSASSLSSSVASTEPNLDGLSCRWNKIPNQRGCVLTLLVMANPDLSIDTQNKLYEKVLNRLEYILTPEVLSNDDETDEDKLGEHNPVNVELATYKTASEMIHDEQRMHFSYWSLAWIMRAVEIILCHILFYWRILQRAIIDAPAYIKGMRTHADHRKYDDMIRMVLDCTPAQANRVEQFLLSMHNKGRQVFYGTLVSRHSLMTCLLEDTAQGKHIHFVDGDNGGYALAAKQLKGQLGKYTMQKRGQGGIGRSSSHRFSLTKLSFRHSVATAPKAKSLDSNPSRRVSDPGVTGT